MDIDTIEQSESRVLANITQQKKAEKDAVLLGTGFMRITVNEDGKVIKDHIPMESVIINQPPTDQQ